MSIGWRIDRTKASFFDKKKVQNAMNRAERKALSAFGAKVRTRAISSILRHPVRKGFGAKSKVSNREGISQPGEPPFAHVGLIPRFLFFAYSFEEHSVVIGPARLNGVKAASTALRTLEEGGEETIAERGISRRARYRKRPFMQPAFQAELPSAPKGFQGELRE